MDSDLSAAAGKAKKTGTVRAVADLAPGTGKLLKPLGKTATRMAEVVGAKAAAVESPIPRPFLEHLGGPEDVKRIPAPLLPELAAEIRAKIDEVVSKTGGHLSSNLGVTELTIALHRVFDFSKDHLVFDVGHQAYPHKLLTGRADRFHTLRQEGGLSGYPDPKESAYDRFHTGHAGCAVGSALGLCMADKLRGEDTHAVAVVGDGAMTSGLVYEALNHAGQVNADLLVILNDNEHSISPTTGGLSATCSRIRTAHFYRRFRDKGRELLERLPYVGKKAEKLASEAFVAVSRAAHAPGALFVDLGFSYFGPIDGHDLGVLQFWLTELKDIKGPKLLHVVTQKGRGREFAAEDPVKWHGAKPYFVERGKVKTIGGSSRPPYTDVVCDTLADVARKDRRVTAITAAMAQGTGLYKFEEEFPERYFDVGICEPHAVIFGAGMAARGLRPVACIYSSFLQRSFDMLQHDVSLQSGLPLTLGIDRAGLVGDDGPTHHGVLDLSCLRTLPHFVLLAPKDAPETRAMLRWAIAADKPTALRYPRCAVPTDLAEKSQPIELGRGELLREGEDLAFLAYGSEVAEALRAAEILAEKHHRHVTVANARFAKPLDLELINDLLKKHRRVFTVEEHSLSGGFGSAVLETGSREGLEIGRLRCLGIPDRFVPHAKRSRQLEFCGLDAAGLVAAVLRDRQVLNFP